MSSFKGKYLWLLIFFVASSDALMCQINPAPEEGSGFGHDLHISDRTGSDMELMTCPGPHDPANYTNCCYGPEEDDNNEGSGAHDPRENMPRCCPPPAFYIDDRAAMIIALSVTAVCVIITVIIIICCFWSSCPLYTACRIRYHQDDIIASAAKDEEMAGLNEMPPEETKGVTIYSPNAVKVTLKDDV